MSEEQKTEVTEEVTEEKTEAPVEAPKKEEKKEAPVEAPKKEEKKEAPAKEKKEAKVPSKFKDLVSEIEKMSVLDLAELVKVLEEKFGVSAAAPMAMAAAPVAGGDAGAADVKAEFSVVLTAVGDKKIEVIKVVRDLTQQGLKESKEIVDNTANDPQTIKEGVAKDEAEEIKKKFTAAGATVELK
jgi:large subunit ribosomal protein L7/L12